MVCVFCGNLPLNLGSLSKCWLDFNVFFCVFRSMRHVFRLRDLRSLRARTKRDSTRPRLFLPHATAQWCHLAHRGHALGSKIRVSLPASDSSHQLSTVHPHARLADHRPGSLHGLRFNPRLDRAIFNRHVNHFEVQKKLGCHCSCFRLWSVLKVVFST